MNAAPIAFNVVAQKLEHQCDRLLLLQELAQMALDALPNSTDSDKPKALLTGMVEILSTDSDKMQRLADVLLAQPTVEARE